MSDEAGYHEPVLEKETVDGLNVREDGRYLDGTLGGGGHFRMIAQRLCSRGFLIGLDRDADAIAHVRSNPPDSPATIYLERAPFSEFDSLLRKHGIDRVDGMLLDLGVSSHQLDDLTRGFSYQRDGKLDMRMDQSRNVTAAHLLQTLDCRELGELLEKYGELRNAQRMARAIGAWRTHNSLTTVAELKRCLHKEYGERLSYKMLAKLFQALRISVNNELQELQLFLQNAVDFLNVGGRLVILAYHSLEDRMVKTFMKQQEQDCICPSPAVRCTCDNRRRLTRINRKAIVASQSEIRSNRRARSARLRIAEKNA
ncbi:MAG: 16S rRNA (cytosine(1402)-N(4))-methyltransferase RsmH [Chitinivibrionales bacterium]|nr:16S rRNA (cytosine(1402)-N(4))-methyltransferase RsmH [Chitinivibrionales bacterium]